MKRVEAEYSVERELADDQKEVLKEMLNSMGFKIFKIYLTNKFNREYKKLRNTKRHAESYERINGVLDGIEFVIKCTEESI